MLPAGLSSEKLPGAMLNPTHIVKLVNELRKDADIVLVAGQPISGFAESLALASQVNGVILVARYGEAHSRMINEVGESLKELNVPVAGVIFEHSPSLFAARRSAKNVVDVTGVPSRVESTASVEKSNVPQA